MLTLSQLEQHLSKAAWILKGPVDAADFKVYIFPLLFFKRISDVYDEEYNEALSESDGDHEYASGAEMHRFIIPKGCHWNEVRATTTNVGSAIKGAFSQIEQANPQYLANIFGDAAWTNKDKLSDELLCRLIEHYSQYNLSNSNVEPDVLGRAYEYLIKMFADQTNKKAGEFYTPRSVVHLMGLIVNPQQGETIYDPACGTAGMLLECVEQVKQNGGDFRTLKLYGQEKNLTTSTIARMNMFLHGIEDFHIERGDTLREPKFFKYDQLQQFNIVIANPPFSLSNWGADIWADDLYGRNIAGTPPKGNGDMAWVQMTQKELESYLWGAATYLRGFIDAGDYKQYIFPLLFYKRICDVYDEEYEDALDESDGDLEYAAFDENHRFKVPAEAHWNKVRQVTVNVGQAISKALNAIQKVNAQQLQGIFGDADWTNKERLSDAMLCQLIEHFSTKNLNINNVPNDELGNAYEFLIKKFADDSGHTAAEFYTNRTVVRLMTLIADPHEGDSVYDPTCGSGGLLLNCAMMLKDQGKEYRTLRLYGQEINLITSGIARMNMLLHGFEEFNIVRGNTLSNPIFMEYDELQKFDIVLANPPYSIKSWDQAAFTDDPYGRNIWGTPPQGCADYAFQQHIMKSLKPDTGRCVVLWPHGILFRDAERDMRRKMIESDCVDCVIGLGPNLFYNSPMEACLLICRTRKPEQRRGKILFINAVDEVKRDKTISMLEERHIDKIFKAYKGYKDIPGFAKVVSNEQILENGATLNISQYVSRLEVKDEMPKQSLEELLVEWGKNREKLYVELNSLI